MKKLLFIIFLFSISNVFSQPSSFVLDQKAGTFNMPTSCIEDTESNLIISRRVGNYNIEKVKFVITKISSSGSIIFNKSIESDSLNYFTTRLVNVNGSIFGVSVLRSLDKKRYYLDIVKFDKDLNVSIQKLHAVHDMGFIYVEPDEIQKNLLILSSDYDWHIHFDRYDYMGNKISEKYNDKIEEFAFSVTRIPNSENKIVSGFNYYYIISPKDSITFIDGLPGFNLFGQGTLLNIKDSIYIYAGKYAENYQGIGFATFKIGQSPKKIVKLKKIGSGDSYYEYPSFFSCLDFKNTNNIFFSGMTNVDFSLTINHESEEKSKIIIGKMNSNLDTTWVKYFGGDAYYATLNTLATSDGGCVVTATRYDNTKPNQTSMYIIKVNDKGEVTATTDIPDEYTQLTAYPSPGNNVFHVKLPFQLIENNQVLDLDLFDLQGKKALSTSKTIDNQEVEINIDNEIPSGLYLFVLKKNRQVLGTGKWIKL